MATTHSRILSQTPPTCVPDHPSELTPEEGQVRCNQHNLLSSAWSYASSYKSHIYEVEDREDQIEKQSEENIAGAYRKINNVDKPMNVFLIMLMWIKKTTLFCHCIFVKPNKKDAQIIHLFP